MDHRDLLRHLPEGDTFYIRTPLGIELSKQAAAAIGSQNPTDVINSIRRGTANRPLVPAILGATSAAWGGAARNLLPEKLRELTASHLDQKGVAYHQHDLQRPEILQFVLGLAIEHVEHYASPGIEDSIVLARVVPRDDLRKAKAAYSNAQTHQTIAIASATPLIVEDVIAGSPDEPDSIWYDEAANALATNITPDPNRRCPALKFTPSVFAMVANVQLAFPESYPVTELGK